MNLSFKYIFTTLLLAGMSINMSSCSKAEKEEFLIFDGEFGQESVLSLKGFDEALIEVLNQKQIPQSQFKELVEKCINWKTSSKSGDLSAQEVADFVNILLSTREKLFEPPINNKYYPNMEESAPVFQKTIPLSEMDYYLNNRFRDIQGKVEYTGDLGETNMENTTIAGIYASMMGFTYPQSPLSDMVDGGYAVVRFRTIGTPDFAFTDQFLRLAGDKLNIKDIMSQKKGLPEGYEDGINGCGLNSLNMPEYFFYLTPVLLKGEIYEITPRGRGILRAVLSDSGWEASEGHVTTKAALPEAFDTNPFNTALCNGLTCFIDGHTFPTFQNTNGLKLVLSQESDLSRKLGFTITPSGRFALPVDINKSTIIDSLGFYFTQARVGTDTFRLRGITPTGYGMLTTTDPQKASELNMKCTDIGTYRKTVSIKEIDELILVGVKLDFK